MVVKLMNKKLIKLWLTKFNCFFNNIKINNCRRAKNIINSNRGYKMIMKFIKVVLMNLLILIKLEL